MNHYWPVKAIDQFLGTGTKLGIETLDSLQSTVTVYWVLPSFFYGSFCWKEMLGRDEGCTNKEADGNEFLPQRAIRCIHLKFDAFLRTAGHGYLLRVGAQRRLGVAPVVRLRHFSTHVHLHWQFIRQWQLSSASCFSGFVLKSGSLDERYSVSYKKTGKLARVRISITY